MELDAMISEICRKVQERVAELEKEEASAEPAAVPSEDNRPALLILAEDHGMRCHPVLESKKLAESASFLFYLFLRKIKWKRSKMTTFGYLQTTKSMIYFIWRVFTKSSYRTFTR